MPPLRLFDAPSSFYPLMDALDSAPSDSPFVGVGGEAIWKRSPGGNMDLHVLSPRLLVENGQDGYDLLPFSTFARQGRACPPIALLPYAELAEQGPLLLLQAPPFEWTVSDDDSGYDMRAFYAFRGGFFLLDTVHDAASLCTTDEILERSAAFMRPSHSAHGAVAARQAFAPLMAWATQQVVQHFEMAQQSFFHEA